MRKKLLVFLGSFLLVYGVLIAPWPGANQLYGAFFRWMGDLAFSRDEGPRVVRFTADNVHHDFSELNARLLLGNRDRADSQGNGPVVLSELNTRSMGWTPTALTIALILASPIPWPRRLRALFLGMVLIHAFILFSLQVRIWDSSPDVGLTAPSPWVKQILDGLDYTLITQMGASFSVPVAIWILITFRRKDLRELF